MSEGIRCEDGALWNIVYRGASMLSVGVSIVSIVVHQLKLADLICIQGIPTRNAIEMPLNRSLPTFDPHTITLLSPSVPPNTLLPVTAHRPLPLSHFPSLPLPPCPFASPSSPHPPSSLVASMNVACRS